MKIWNNAITHNNDFVSYQFELVMPTYMLRPNQAFFLSKLLLVHLEIH